MEPVHEGAAAGRIPISLEESFAACALFDIQSQSPYN